MCLHLHPPTPVVNFPPPQSVSREWNLFSLGGLCSSYSLEFFTFPEYIQDLPSTTTCLQNLKDLTGTWPPVRIGGTTQYDLTSFPKKSHTNLDRDRATYDASSSEAVTYTVASTKDAPTTLTYGPSFVSLAAEYAGKVILGLNRRLDNISNTIAAALLAQKNMDNLYSIELGNEPNCQSQQS